MTQAMKCRYQEGVCDPHKTGHEANEQTFLDYHIEKMCSDAAQQMPWYCTNGDSERDPATKELVKSFSVIPSHSRIIQQRDRRPHCS